MLWLVLRVIIRDFLKVSPFTPCEWLIRSCSWGNRISAIFLPTFLGSATRFGFIFVSCHDCYSCVLLAIIFLSRTRPQHMTHRPLVCSHCFGRNFWLTHLYVPSNSIIIASCSAQPILYEYTSISQLIFLGTGFEPFKWLVWGNCHHHWNSPRSIQKTNSTEQLFCFWYETCDMEIRHILVNACRHNGHVFDW